ncbi:MAG: hypothetical protein ACJAUP_000161 [Cellvibrionaceae bacterium]|jgi:uncharacterized protein (DUF58 family)
MVTNQNITQSKSAKTKQTTGAYVELSTLQELRYLASTYSSSKNLANNAENSGSHRSKALNRGMEFEQVRLYQAGDDVRNIDWRVTARTQATHTKCYSDEKEKPVITLVDQRRSLFFGSQYCFKSVYACELSALINWSTLKRGDRAGGIVVGTHGIHETRPARSPKAVNQWLQLLNTTNNELSSQATHNEPSLYESLQQLHRIAKSGTECIIISDFYDLDTNCEKQLYSLARHNPVSFYWLIDPLEKMLPALPHIILSDGKEKSLFSIGKKQQRQQAKLFNNKHKNISGLCIRLGIKLMPVNIQEPLSIQLLNGSMPACSLNDTGEA